MAEPQATPCPSSAYLFAACCTLEAAHEHEQIEAAKRMLQRYDLTYDSAIAELQRRGVIPFDEA